MLFAINPAVNQTQGNRELHSIDVMCFKSVPESSVARITCVRLQKCVGGVPAPQVFCFLGFVFLNIHGIFVFLREGFVGHSHSTLKHLQPYPEHVGLDALRMAQIGGVNDGN